MFLSNTDCRVIFVCKKHQALDVMDKIEINTYFGDKSTHVEIAAPMGAGGIYHVMLDKYYNGQIMKSHNGWRVNLYPTTILQGDDVAVIIELIEEGFCE
jgi:hypothetical protein